MSSMILNGDTSGAITLAAPSVAGTNTATLPAATGTVMVSGNMPAFSVYSATVTTFSSALTFTKITLANKEFDTANCFDNTTNYRFTPTVAGYYQITGPWGLNNSATYAYAAIYKNGSSFKATLSYQNAGTSNFVSALVYMNGSTDYVEFYGAVQGGSFPNTSFGNGAALYTYFQGVLVRAA